VSAVRIMGIDHGEARVGCAICDPTETIVRPLPTMQPPEPTAVAGLAAREGAELIVVGLPVTLGGEEGEQAAAARQFAGALRAASGLPVATYDERLTTRMATVTARGGATAAPDSIAAAHLLEAYLAWRGRRGEGPGES
jgi:putative Holliday junction resolvase